MKRIVISDTHIGSKFYKSDELIRFLKSVEYDELILAGDIIEFIRIPLFDERIKEITNSIDFSKKIIYVVGNHDTPLLGLINTKTFKINFVKEYIFNEGGRLFKVEHGDSYDDFFVKSNVFMMFVTATQNCIEHWFNFNLMDLYTSLKIKIRKYRRIWDIISLNKEYDVLICGHSHIPECVIWISPEQKIQTYINSGDWVSNCTYVEINDGIARLKKYDNSNNNIKGN